MQASDSEDSESSSATPRRQVAVGAGHEVASPSTSVILGAIQVGSPSLVADSSGIGTDIGTSSFNTSPPNPQRLRRQITSDDDDDSSSSSSSTATEEPEVVSPAVAAQVDVSVEREVDVQLEAEFARRFPWDVPDQPTLEPPHPQKAQHDSDSGSESEDQPRKADFASAPDTPGATLPSGRAEQPQAQISSGDSSESEDERGRADVSIIPEKQSSTPQPMLDEPSQGEAPDAPTKPSEHVQTELDSRPKAMLRSSPSRESMLPPADRLDALGSHCISLAETMRVLGCQKMDRRLRAKELLANLQTLRKELLQEKSATMLPEGQVPSDAAQHPPAALLPAVAEDEDEAKEDAKKLGLDSDKASDDEEDQKVLTACEADDQKQSESSSGKGNDAGGAERHDEILVRAGKSIESSAGNALGVPSQLAVSTGPVGGLDDAAPVVPPPAASEANVVSVADDMLESLASTD